MLGTHNGCGGLQRQYDWASIPPSVAIIESIAVFDHGDPGRMADVLDSPLYEYVDPDALNDLIRSDTPVTIVFTISDHHIHITENTVCVSPAEKSTATSQ